MTGHAGREAGLYGDYFNVIWCSWEKWGEKWETGVAWFFSSRQLEYYFFLQKSDQLSAPGERDVDLPALE